MMDSHCYSDHYDNADDVGGCSVVTSPVHVPSNHVFAGWCHVAATEDNNSAHVKKHHNHLGGYSVAGLY